jgi:hypothetical protein
MKYNNNQIYNSPIFDSNAEVILLKPEHESLGGPGTYTTFASSLCVPLGGESGMHEKWRENFLNSLLKNT